MSLRVSSWFRKSALCILFSAFCGTALAQNQTINGNLTVTGSIEAVGPIDSGDNTLTFGTQGSAFGGALLHQDNSTDTFTFFSNRNPASWLWQHTVGIAAMRLDASHQLILYQSNGTTAGLTLTPASNSIKLGTHANGTLTADTNGVITAGGGFAVAGGITNANGALTGGASGLMLNAGDANQNITLATTGNGIVQINSRVLVNNSTSSTSPLTGALVVNGGVGIGGAIVVGGTVTGTNISGTSSVTSPTLYMEDFVDFSGFRLGHTYNGSGLTADRYILWHTRNGNRGIDLSGNLTLANNFTTSGNFGLTLTQTGTTNVTLPTTGRLATLAGTETLTGKTISAASNAVGADTVEVVDSTDSTSSVLIADSATGSLAVKTDGGLTYDSSTGNLTATWISTPLIKTPLIHNGSQPVNFFTTSPMSVKVSVGYGNITIGAHSAGEGTGFLYMPTISTPATVYGAWVRPTVKAGGGHPVGYVSNIYLTNANPASLTDFYAYQGTYTNSTPVVHTGFWADANLIGATTNYGFRGSIPAGTARYNLYMDGTAPSYFSGNVGIGTTTPTEKLEVVGNLKVSGTFIAANYATTGGTLTGGATGLNLAAGGTNQNIALTPTGTGSIVLAGNVGVGTATPGAAIDIFGNSKAVRLIAATDPAYRLTIENNWSDANSMNIKGVNDSVIMGVYAGNTALMTGNVGIGTLNPSPAKLVVASPQTTSNNTLLAEFTKSGGTNTYGSAILRLSRSVGGESVDMELNSGGSGPFRYGTYADSLFVSNQNSTNGPYGSIHFVTNSAPRLTIGGGTLAGNVGIGTTSPTSKLVIKAASDAPQLSLWQYNWDGGFEIKAPSDGSFGIFRSTIAVPRLLIDPAGNVGIGTTVPTHKLAVKGTIRAEEVIVDTGWADYVFEEDYRLAPLAEVEQHIREKKHLPGIPSAAEVAEHGVSMGDMQSKLLSKVEELTLHLIRMEKENTELRQRVQVLEAHR